MEAPNLTTAVSFDEKNEARLQKMLSQYPDAQAVLLPALWLAMDQFGYLTTEVMEYVAERLDVAPVEVFSVVEFYTMFKTEPQAQHQIQLCRNLTCCMRGYESLQDMIKQKIGIGPGEKSEDGLFSLELVECLGSCGTAPVMRMDNRYFENLSEDKLDRVIQACRDGRDPAEEDR